MECIPIIILVGNLLRKFCVGLAIELRLVCHRNDTRERWRVEGPVICAHRATSVVVEPVRVLNVQPHALGAQILMAHWTLRYRIHLSSLVIQRGTALAAF